MAARPTGGGRALATDLPAINPGTAPNVLHPAKMPAAPDKKATTPSTARVQALDNIARRGGRIGTARGGPPMGMTSTAHLGKNLPASGEANC